MKLKRVSPPEGSTRIALPLAASLRADLDLYVRFYESVHDEAITVNKAIEAMLKQFLASDGKFRAYKSRAAQSTGRVPVAAPASVRARKRATGTTEDLSTDPARAAAAAQPSLALDTDDEHGPEAGARSTGATQ